MLLWTYGIKPAELEVFSSTKWPPNGKCVLTTDVAESQDGSKVADLEDDVDLKIYMDGSGQDNMAGATAILNKGGTVVKAL